MSSPVRTLSAIVAATLCTLLAAGLAGARYWLPDASLESLGLEGRAVQALLPVQALLVLTLLAYLLAAVVPQNRLALIQSATIGLWGLAMIALGIALITGGLGLFAARLALLLAFPFGTIAYFVKYSCTEGALGPAAQPYADLLGGGCMTGVQVAALGTVVLSAAALAILVIAAPRFIKVLGLSWITLLLAAMGLGIGLGYGFLTDLRFLLALVDGVAMAVLGLFVVLHGATTFVKSLFAFALAIAGQAG